MEYTISTGSKRKVKFPCPACQSPLECPLTDAGQQFPCPTCAAVFTVPGVKELEGQQNYEKQKAKANEVRREQETQAVYTSMYKKKPESEGAELIKHPKESTNEKSAAANDKYVSITRGAALINTAGGAFAIFGALSTIAGVYFFCRYFFGGGDSAYIAAGGQSLLGAISLFVTALLLRMVASVGLAIRDIAINSFHPKPG